ncbi:MAG: DUF2520 domain-containing protein [Acidimicrobiales bacterium]
MASMRIVGGGRAGGSFETALCESGHDVVEVLHRGDDVSRAARGVDAVLLAVPDRFVKDIARAITAQSSTAVIHLSGSLGLDVLATHERRASLHPLVTLPDRVIGAMRLRGAFFAVAGDQVATDVALSLGGHPIVVRDEDRPTYHAAACIAANHLVGLLGQVQRVAGEIGLPLEAFLPLAQGALDDVRMLGPELALTGPAARGDCPIIERDRAALSEAERDGYDAGVALAARLTVSGTRKWR